MISPDFLTKKRVCSIISLHREIAAFSYTLSLIQEPQLAKKFNKIRNDVFKLMEPELMESSKIYGPEFKLKQSNRQYEAE